jgi:ferredoxin-NADP reductase
VSNRARLVGVRPVAAGVFEYRLLPLEPPRLDFRAGQYLSLDCGLDAQGLPARRAYSIASPPHAEHLVICAKLIPGGLASSVLGRLCVGDEIDFTGPTGFFVLDERHAGDVVFGVTGTGIAPVVPMLEELLARDEAGRVLLFWGLRTAADAFYRDAIAELAARSPRLEVHVSLTHPEPEWRGEQGRINAKLLAAVPELRAPVFYLVGNGAMIEEVRAALKARGVGRRQIRTEAFYTPEPAPA